MRKTLFLISLALSSAACSDVEEYREKAAVAEAPQQAASTAKAPAGKPFALTDNEESNGGSREYSYSWPVEVSREPGLVARFRAAIAKDLAAQKQDWRNAMAECPPEAVSCRSNSLSVEWKVVADLPRFLSLSSDMASYTGGAHGNYGRSALVWDRKLGTAIDPKDMFDLAALERATGAARCRLLNAERAERRGEPVAEGGREWPDDCPDMESVVLFVGSSNRKAFDRLGFYYGPYVAGPYAEGEYEVDLPVDAAVLAAVKPTYRSAFAAMR